MVDKYLFDKSVECPVCSGPFVTKIVKTSTLRLKKKDPDFCGYYYDIIPYIYDVWVCPHCGYAAFNTKFNAILPDEAKVVRKGLLGKWVEYDYGNVRTEAEGIKAYLLAAFTLSLKQSVKPSEKASIWLKTAWIYRSLNNMSGDKKYIEKAVACYKDMYADERLPVGNMTDAHVSYLIGELSRRLGNTKDAIMWFAKAVRSPELRNSGQIERLARDQWMEMRTELRDKKIITEEEDKAMDSGKVDDIESIIKSKNM